MPLQLLYGPVTCTIDPDDSTLGGTPTHNSNDAFWYDDYGYVVGANSVTGAGLSPVFVIDIDGVYRLRKNQPSVFGYGDFMYDYLRDAGMCLVGSQLSQLDPETGTFKFGGIIRSSTTTNQLRTPEGFYRVSGSAVQRAPLNATSDSDYVTEFTLTNPDTFIAPSTLSPGPDSRFFICYTTGAIIQYDYIAKTEVAVNPSRAFDNNNRWVLGITPRRCCYSPKLNCFIVLDGDGIAADTISIYSLELVPDNITAPTASPAITAGAVSTISVTLRDGGGNRGIRDRLIDWSITAGNGTLLQTQSTTDADGIATTQYRAPITGGVNPTIQASLTY
jgi:hypothetical protein